MTWLAKQKFCNGNIGMTGGSYEGYCTWIVAPEAHPALKAIAPLVPLPDPVINVPYQNDAFLLEYARLGTDGLRQNQPECRPY